MVYGVKLAQAVAADNSRPDDTVNDKDDVRDEVPQDRQVRRRARTREALLASAAELFAAQGVEATAIAQIAEGADVGYGSFYNHFRGLEDIAEVLLARRVQDILAVTDAIMAEVNDPRLLPCVGARVILRSCLRDAVVRWMLERPYLLVETFQRQAAPFMERFETPGIESGALKPAAGHETWMRTLPWLLLSELHYAVVDSEGDPLAHEESFATICLRLLGVDDADVEGLLVESLSLIDANWPGSAGVG
jgi:AcrR family transcriptional regulator